MEVLDPADERGWGPRHAHDPTAVRDDDGTYYLFSTDAYAGGPPRGGVQVRRSTDLATWEFHGYALDGVPAEGARWAGALGLWAPEVVHVQAGDVDEWRMYWSASSFGSRTSMIGLAVAAAPTGPWRERGIAVSSRHETDGPNAIDANAVVDADGRHWLVYGSFFAGIYVLELDPATGLSIDVPPGTCLARRAAPVEGAIEGPFVVPRPGGGYALLVSYDSLFSTYHVRVGVGPAVAGPYTDLAGHDLTDVRSDPASVGTTILAGHRFAGGRVWLAPGHGSVLTDGDCQFFVHHVRDGDDPTQHEVQVRRLVWTAHGWPVVSPQPWAGALEAGTDAGGRPGAPVPPASVADLVGRWEVVTFDGSGQDVVDARELVVAPADTARVVLRDSGRFTWTDGDASFEGVALASWDAVRARPAWSFTGLDGNGCASFGTRVADA